MQLALSEGSCERASQCLHGAVCQAHPRASTARQPGPSWSWGLSSSAPAHTPSVDAACSGVTCNLHGCSLSWFEPMSAPGFASVQLSWFCFTTVLVVDSNAAQHKEVVASFLSASGLTFKGYHPSCTDMTLICKNCLSFLPNSLLFLDKTIHYNSPSPNFTQRTALLTFPPELSKAVLLRVFSLSCLNHKVI